MPVAAKVCGLTRPEDAAAAAAAGAAWLGVILAGGPRQVTVERAGAIVAAARPTPVLGVFGRTEPAEVIRIARLAGLAGAQLHGAHTAGGAAALRGEGLLVWRVLRMRGPEDLETVPRVAEHADVVLVEPLVEGREGGGGVVLPLALALAARRALAGIPFALAGGLTPESVAGAIRRVRPDIVDVSSGVEAAIGIKDPARVVRFLEAVSVGALAP